MDNAEKVFVVGVSIAVVIGVLMGLVFFEFKQLIKPTEEAEVYSKDFLEGFTTGMLVQENLRELSLDENGCFDFDKSMIVTETIIGRIKNQDENYLPLNTTGAN